ncbi:MAG: TonB-dependent receptor plug domain-containing protein [Pseudomonadales bacterium]|nr:TonB-dependent receptor plug domain-containing protein [Pseudomonadales bacterium]
MKRKSYVLAAAILLAHQPKLAAQEVSADTVVAGQITLTERPALPMAKIEEIVTTGRYVPDEKRATAAISNVIDAEAFQRAGDSNVADGLKRVAGLNLQAGRFIYIRGLGERYSSSMINGSTLPSPEPLNRVVPLDLFPASIIDSVLVQKTYSAQLPAEFAGGTVQMRTKAVPDEAFFEVSSNLGYAGNTSFQKGFTYDGGGKDWLGTDNGTRAIPESLQSAIADGNKLRKNSAIFNGGVDAAELETIGESLSNNYSLKNSNLGPNTGMGASFGTRYELGDVVLGLTSSLSYNNSWDSKDVIRNSFSVNETESGVELTPFDRQVFSSTEQTIESSMFVTGGLQYKDDHTIKATFLKLRKADDQASLLTGFQATESLDIEQTRLEFISRELSSFQIEGEHVFYKWNELTLNWHYSGAQATRNAPDMRQFRFDINPITGESVFSVRGDGNQRVWSTLKDNNDDFGFSAKLFLQTPFSTSTDLSFGMNRVEKDRASEIRRFAFISQGVASNDQDLRLLPLDQILSPENIGPAAFELRETTRSTDTYSADQTIDAYFVEADVELSPSFRLLAGLRWEQSKQNVTTFDLFKPEVGAIDSRLNSDDLFPVVTGTYILDEQNMQFRLGYSKTTSRPDFRELSPSPFTHPVTGFEIIGNPDLTVAFIKNYDFRWEWYFAGTDNVSIGLFYKELQNPIEAVIEAGPANRRTFINADVAETYGVEFDASKQLDFISDRLENWYVSGNLSLIESTVDIRPEDAGLLTNRTRALQGQANYIFNMQLGYDDLYRNRVSLVYNLTGEKIREVGVLGAPDVVDDAYGELDLVYTHYWNDKLTMGFKAKNLMNNSRDTTQGGLIVNGFKEGRNLSLSLNYDF